MNIYTRCTLSLALATFLLSSFCTKAPAAAQPSPAGAAACLPAPTCPLLPSPLSASWPPPDVIDLMETFLPIVNKSLLFLYTNLSSFSAFTIDFADELIVGCPPSLAFSLLQSPLIIMELIFDFGIGHSCATAEQTSLIALCESQEPRGQQPTNSSCKAAAMDHLDTEETQFNYSVSLAYDADSTALHVLAEVSYGDGFEINQAFILNTTDLQPYVNDTDRGKDDSIGLLVGYSTRGKANVRVSTSNDATSPSYEPITQHKPDLPHKSKSDRVMVVVWVVVGVSVLAILVGLTTLAISLKKQYARRQSSPLIHPHLGSRHVILPSTTTRASTPHPPLDSGSTPMICTLRPSPQCHTKDFQLSGTASWLKQPNPR